MRLTIPVLFCVSKEPGNTAFTGKISICGDALVHSFDYKCGKVLKATELMKTEIQVPLKVRYPTSWKHGL